jgi:PKD repeat protein
MRDPPSALRRRVDGFARRRRARLAVLSAAAVVAVGGALAAPDLAAADFTFAQTGSLTVQFTGPSGAVAYAWNFGDGQGSASQNPSHIFPAAGTYDVHLAAAPDGVPVTKAVTVYATPVAAFVAQPQTGTLSVALADKSTGQPTSRSWNFGDGQGSALPSPTHAYAAPGTYTVTLTVTNPAGSTSASVSVTVAANRSPIATFTATPNPSAVGVAVAFNASASADPDLDPLTYAWDVDNDGQFDDGALATASTTFLKAGSYIVRLKVGDGHGQSDTQAQVVTVLDEKPPVAAFTLTSVLPALGETVTFTSTSTDPDGTIVALDWDLDGDGQFDDAQGPTAQSSFTVAGPHLVSLKATDNHGVATIAYQTVNVTAPSTAGSAAPPVPSPSSQRAPARLMSPFPLVRIRGRVVGARVYIDLLTVRAPKGATVRLRCHGRDCPYASAKSVAGPASRLVRFRGIQGRVTRGTVIELFVTKPGAIGKYTRFRVRVGRAPTRQDLCLAPGSMRPRRCPVQ